MSGGNRRPVLRHGDEGADVADLQRLLGMKTGNGVGAFDSLTEAAVRTFQRRHRLTVSGVVDAETWAKLERH